MLDFLRRKDKRKLPSQDNLQFNPANVVKYPVPPHQQSAQPQQPLRDRNPTPRPRAPSPPQAKVNNSYSNLPPPANLNTSSSAASATTTKPNVPAPIPLRRTNTQRRQKPLASSTTANATNTMYDKENSSSAIFRSNNNVPIQQQQQLQHENDRSQTATNVSEFTTSRNRWGGGKREQKQSQAQQQQQQVSGSSSITQPAATDNGKKKRNRRLKNKHEAAVLTKAVTSDRRRSIKAPAPISTSQEPASKRAVGNPSPVPVPSPQQVGSQQSQQYQQPQQPGSHYRQYQAPVQTTNGILKQTQVSQSQQQQQNDFIMPLLELAEMVKSKDVSKAQSPITRVAMAASRDDFHRVRLAKEGAAATIVGLLSNPNSTLDMRRHATFALAEFALVDACADSLVQAGVVVVLIWLTNVSNNSDNSTLSSACRALRNLLDGKESIAIHAARYGCVEPLLSLISGKTNPIINDHSVIAEAVAAISNLLNHGPKFQSYVIKHGGFHALCHLGFKSDNDESLFHVVNVLAECAKEPRWHKPIVHEGGVNVALRVLRIAQDPEVASESSRLIGNIANTHKARSSVRDAGGIIALIDRLLQCCLPSVSNASNRQEPSNVVGAEYKIVPAFDILRALANVCVDSRAASDAVAHKEAASTLLSIYTAENTPEKLIGASFHVLQVLAQGSATRRAKVLYAVGIQMKRAAMAGMPVKRLYDLRQAILEDVETGEKDSSTAMPESLERLSRASVRMINSGVVNYSRGAAFGGNNQAVGSTSKRTSAHNNASNGQSSSTQPGRNSGRTQQQIQLQEQQARRQQQKHPNHQQPTTTRKNVVIGTAEDYRDEGPSSINRKSVNQERNKFKSTGRVVSVTHKGRRKNNNTNNLGMKQLAEGRVSVAEDDYDLPRGNEEVLRGQGAAELRARMLEREADGNMVQDFFELGQVLGKGGYGSVFMAKDLRTGEIVAIKRFHNSGSLVDKKAIKEQKIWKGLHHPNVVEFKGSYVGDNGSLNLVVEYVDGLSLAEHLSQYSAFPETLVAEIARQVLCGLAYLHGNGVTHRDLKPANILVDNSAAVKICDFGVSRSDNVQTINPGQQHMVGTPWYIAPEMVEYRPYTTSVDIWSLGCTVLELATGRRPYHELSAMQVLFRMVEDRCPPIPTHLSTDARDFLKACWIWDPQQRPSANQLLQHPFILKARKFSDSSKQSSSDNQGYSASEEFD